MTLTPNSRMQLSMYDGTLFKHSNSNCHSSTAATMHKADIDTRRHVESGHMHLGMLGGSLWSFCAVGCGLQHSSVANMYMCTLPATGLWIRYAPTGVEQACAASSYQNVPKCRIHLQGVQD